MPSNSKEYNQKYYQENKERLQAYQRERRKDPETRAKVLATAREANAKRRKDPVVRAQEQMTARCQRCSYRKWWADAREELGFGACAACGSTQHIHMHHLDESEKSFSHAQMGNRCPSAERLELYIAELKKCIPLCQHCHNDIHATRNPKRQERVTAGLINFTLRNL